VDILLRDDLPRSAGAPEARHLRDEVADGLRVVIRGAEVPATSNLHLHGIDLGESEVSGSRSCGPPILTAGPPWQQSWSRSEHLAEHYYP